MLQNLFKNMPPVVKNLLLINIIMMLAKVVLTSQGIPLSEILGAYYWESPNFEPYQILTHMFMHGDIMHILFNMFALLMFGSQLERVWGAKRFLIFYLACGFGAYVLHNLVTMIEVSQWINALGPELYADFLKEGTEMLENGQVYSTVSADAQVGLYHMINTEMVGASGAIFGLLAGFAFLFPNTKLMLLFPPIPIKAKWFVLGYAAIELYMGIQNNPSDSVAHFAHLGGAAVGLVFLLIWQRNKNKFY